MPNENYKQLNISELCELTAEVGKGTPQFPQCGYSGRAVQMLKSCAVPFVGVNVLGNEPLRAGLVEYAQWPTLPQLWIGGEFIGGCDIMTEMFQSGDLQKQLAALSTKDA